MYPKKSIDISRQWADDVCCEIELRSMLFQILLRRQLCYACQLTNEEFLKREGVFKVTHIAMTIYLYEEIFVEEPLTTPSV